MELVKSNRINIVDDTAIGQIDLKIIKSNDILFPAADQFGVAECQKHFKIDIDESIPLYNKELFKSDSELVYATSHSIYDNPTGAGVRTC